MSCLQSANSFYWRRSSWNPVVQIYHDLHHFSKPCFFGWLTYNNIIVSVFLFHTQRFWNSTSIICGGHHRWLSLSFLHPWKFTWKETKCLKIGNCTLWPLSILSSLVPQITMRPGMIRDGSYYCFLIAIASSARKFINLQTSSHHARHDACTSLFLIFFTETCLVFSSCLLLALKKKILIFRGGNFTN